MEKYLNEPIHTALSGHLPWFVSAPHETDVLLIVTALFLLVFAVMIGLAYLWLHALPDRLAHKKAQLKIVCVLGLLAMFTHMHIFWIAGLLLALIDFPDFSGPLKRIAGSTEKMAAGTDSKSAEAAETILPG